jgi:periplasmic divalent cation tolerance protein
MSAIRFVYVPCPSVDVAKSIAKSTLHARLAACANVFSGVQSLYWWDGELQDDAEAVLLLKTDADHADALAAHVIEVHPYDVPCVAVIAPESVNAAYADWLISELG